jgi:hypothetical protein
MARHQALATVWQPIAQHEPICQPIAEHEPIQIVADDGDPVRGILIGLGISTVLWAALGAGIWFALRLPT